MYKFIFKFVFVIQIFLIFSNVCYALAPSGIGDLGQFATSLMEPVEVLSDFMATGALIIGLMLVFAGIIRYTQYRTNPMAYPLSTVLTLLILGILLLLLPFVYKLSAGGIQPYFLKTSKLSLN